MKKLQIEIRITEGKIASAIKTEGYDRENISAQLELLGLLENTKTIIQDRITKLLDISK